MINKDKYKEKDMLMRTGRVLINKSLALTLLIILIGHLSQALEENDQTFTLDGQLFRSGTTNPLTDSSVKIVIQVLNPDKTCILYEETQSNINLSQTNGYFNIKIGSPKLGSSKRTPAVDPGNTMAEVFQNSKPIAGTHAPSRTCITATSALNVYKPSAGDTRYFRMIVTPSSGVADTLSPDFAINSVPSSLVAETVQGVGKDSLIQADGSVAFTANQSMNNHKLTNLATPTVGTDAVTKDYVDTAISGVSGGGGGSLILADGSVPFAANQSMGNFRITNLSNPSGAQDAATKSYVDTAVSSKQDSLGFSPVNKAGDTMTGELILPGNPSTSLAATTKGYVDTGLSGKQDALGFTPANTTGWTNASVMGVNGSGNLTAYPGTTAGTILQHSPTGPSWSSATYPSSTTANQLLYSSSNNVVTGLATANNAILTTNGSGVPSWSALSGDAFSQYALLAGRSGGQTIYGGTAASNNLTLESTSDATKGNVIIAGNGGKVGIGTTNPQAALQTQLYSSSGRYVRLNDMTETGTFPLGSRSTFRGDDNNTGINLIVLENLDNTPALNHGNAILFRFSYTSGSNTPVSAGRVIFQKENEWTSTASTQNSSFGISTARNGSLSTKLTVTSSGNVGVGTTSPVGLLNLSKSDSSILSPIMSGVNTITGGGSVLSIHNTSSTDGGYSALELRALSSTGNIQSSYIATQSTTGVNVGNLIFGVRNSGNMIERMRIDTNGNVGIGTSSPTQRLEVSGNALLTGQVGIGSSTPLGSISIMNGTNIATSTFNITQNLANDGGVVNKGTATALYLSGTSTKSAYGSTSGIETLPSNVDNVTGSQFGSYNYVYHAGTGTISNALALKTQLENASTGNITNSYGMTSTIKNGSSGTVSNGVGISSYITNSSTGNVVQSWGLHGDIRNTSSGTMTEVYGVSSYIENSSTGTISDYGIAGNFRILNYGAITNNLIGGNLSITNSATTGTVPTIKSAQHLVKNTSTGSITNAVGAGIQMSSTSTGSITNIYGVSIGGPTDAWSLSGGGTITNSYGLYLGSTIDIGANKYSIYSESTSPSYFAGNVGIGTTSPSYKLDVSGDIRIASGSKLYIATTAMCDSTGCTAAPSDIRFKKNIEFLNDSLNKIMNLQGVSYDWKDQKAFSDQPQIGFIAQDVEKIYPEIVKTDPKTGFKSVMYDKLVAPIVESVKTLYRYIVFIQNQQDSQKNEILQMKSLKADKSEVERIKLNNLQLKEEIDMKDKKIKELEQRLEKLERLFDSK